MLLIPLSDASRRPIRFPIVTASLIVVNAMVFLLEVSGGEAFVRSWALVPADITSGHRWITVFTSMFLHGSWSHLISNMIFLWAFGPEVEDLIGPRRYTFFYLLGGIAASLAQIAAGPASTVPGVGASGAIASVMGAFLVTYPADQIRSLLIIFVFVRVAYLPAALLIGFWALTQFLHLGMVASHAEGGVAYSAHVGGFIFGTVAARLFEGLSSSATANSST
jgi:membrane associated rhomboid family serine protease